MDEQEARLILQAYRVGEQDRNDPQFSAALRTAAETPELASWFSEEQAFDQAIAKHLETVPAPFGLKTRILAQNRASKPRASTRWLVGLAALAATLALLAQGFSLWRGSPQSAGAPAEFAGEMVSFIQLTPPLELESNDLNAIKGWLSERKAMPMKVPARLTTLEPIGCRVLSFRGHDVTLICFRRGQNRLAHLFTVEHAAMPSVKAGAKPVFTNKNGWMTATWAEEGAVYMITMQGGRAAVEEYLPSA